MNPKWLSLGFKLFPYVLSSIEAVEKLLHSSKGKEKQDAAVEVAKVLLSSVEGGLSKDLLDDEAVSDATRKFIDAAVALQNVLAKRTK